MFRSESAYAEINIEESRGRELGIYDDKRQEFNLYVCSAASYVVGFVGGVLEKRSECGGGQNKISHGGPSTAFPQVGHC